MALYYFGSEVIGSEVEVILYSTSLSVRRFLTNSYSCTTPITKQKILGCALRFFVPRGLPTIGDWPPAAPTLRSAPTAMHHFKSTKRLRKRRLTDIPY